MMDVMIDRSCDDGCRLGVDMLMSAHGAVAALQQCMDPSVNEEAELACIRARLGPQWMYFPVIVQLVNAEACL